MAMRCNETTRSRLAAWFGHWAKPLRQHLALRGRLSPADADDVAQEVFLRLLRYERSELVSHPQAYLFKIAANVLSEWSTRARWKQPHASEWLGDLADERDPAHELAQADAHFNLRSAIAALPGRARDILRLHYEEGLTHESIAQRLGVTRRIVNRDLMRAYADLRIAIGGPAATPAAAASRSGGK
ncbi:MAG: sigma-70 family RNA polymerase sigma factor [Steroidobacteraceae bacterium]